MNTTGIIAIAAAVLFLFWLARLLWLYEGPCGWCKGSGKRWGSNERMRGPCPFCGGSGRRYRLGARTARRLILRKTDDRKKK